MDHLDPKWLGFVIYLVLRMQQFQKYHLLRWVMSYLNSDWKRIKHYQFLINGKFKNIFYLFTCILTLEITKEFWKNSHFRNVTAGFLLRCQNSHRWSTPEKNHFRNVFTFIFTNIAPLIVIVLTICSLCCIYIIFWNNTIAKRQICFHKQYCNGKSSIFLTEVNFDTSEKETGCHISKMAISSKFFGDFMRPIIR